jgi:hypothetical protein
MEKMLEEARERIRIMRSGGMEISPALEMIILKEKELAFKDGQIAVIEERIAELKQ